MPTGLDLANAQRAVLTIPGAHYGSWDCPHRCNPELWPHCEDCSGSLTAALRNIGIDWGGCLGSFEQARICYAAGGLIPFSVARVTPGALLCQGINQGRGGIPGVDPGHIGVSAGDGLHSYEARGHTAGIGIFRIDSLVWTGCYRARNITYGAAPAPTPQPVPPLAVKDDNDMISMPNTHLTPAGRVATARPIPSRNLVLLEDGARVDGDMPVAGAPASTRWWAPHTGQIPGWQLVGIVRLPAEAAGTPYANGSVVARYEFPNNGGSGTYKTAIVTT